MLSADLPVLVPLVKSGKVRALALFATERSPLLPDVPTSAELGYPGMLMNNWYGMLAPAGMPADVQAIAGEGDARGHEKPDGRAASGRGRRGRRRPTARSFAERLARDAAYWGPELKKLGISGE